MQHGYFDDFRAVRDQQGKIFASPNRLIDAQVAQRFPPTQVRTALFPSMKQSVAEAVAAKALHYQDALHKISCLKLAA